VTSPLENLSGPGRPLKKEPPDAKEFAGLRRSAIARLTDSAKSSNSLESRFDLAYISAHQFLRSYSRSASRTNSLIVRCSRFAISVARASISGGKLPPAAATPGAIYG
jgi:hypothetical protein